MKMNVGERIVMKSGELMGAVAVVAKEFDTVGIFELAEPNLDGQAFMMWLVDNEYVVIEAVKMCLVGDESLLS